MLLVASGLRSGSQLGVKPPGKGRRGAAGATATASKGCDQGSYSGVSPLLTLIDRAGAHSELLPTRSMTQYVTS